MFLPDSEKDVWMILELRLWPIVPFDFRPVPFDFSNIGLKEQEALRSYTVSANRNKETGTKS